MNEHRPAICHLKWESLERISDTTSHCNLCGHNVMDFSMEDPKIIKAFITLNPGTCIRYPVSILKPKSTSFITGSLKTIFINTVLSLIFIPALAITKQNKPFAIDVPFSDSTLACQTSKDKKIRKKYYLVTGEDRALYFSVKFPFIHREINYKMGSLFW